LPNSKHPEYIPRPASKTNILSTVPHCLSETREQGRAPLFQCPSQPRRLTTESNPRLEKRKLTAPIFDCQGVTFLKDSFS